VSSSSSGPPDEPVFCIDEALGKRVVPDALRAAGVRVELLIDHHPRGTADATWLADIGRRGWVVLTKDKNMRRRPAEQLAVVKNGVRAFSLTSGDLSGPEMADAFLKAMPRIRSLLRRHPGPFIASVTRSGQLAIVYPPRA